MAELLQQVRVLDPLTHTDRIADVLLDEQQVLAIEAQIDPVDHTLIASGADWVLGPGLADLYSHSGEPGHEPRETLTSLTAAARAGGFTRLAILPDTQPTLDHPGIVQTLKDAAMLPGQWQYWGAISQQLNGQQMVEYADLQDYVVGFSDGRAIADWTLLYQVLTYLQGSNKPIALCPQIVALEQQGVVRESLAALRLGLTTQPTCAETVAIAGIIELVATLGTPVHLMKVSTARGVDLICQAKERGLPITASTTWLHLICDVEDLETYNPNLHLAPPLGTATDRQALVAGVKSGVIDAIAVDHTPYTYEEKTVSFADAPPGAIGLELALPLLWNQLVSTEHLTPLELWRSLSTAPAQCLNQEPAQCTAGARLELALFNIQQSWDVTAQNLRSRSCNTHLLNQTIQGRVERTFWHE